jgi:uncharacterized membrane protein
MLILVAGLFIFIGVHCLPMKVALRARLIDKMGLIPYKISFASVSLLGLGLIVWGRGGADFIEIWQPFGWLRYATVILMFPAVLLVLAAYSPDNSIRRILGHPMMLGVELWAIAHLLVNGDLASILFFGGFLLWSLVAFASASRRQPPRGGRAKIFNDIITVSLALVVYVAAIRGHVWFAGVALISQ